MDPRSNNTSGLGLPQPGSDMGQLPPIHAPDSFHAPDTAASHFDTAAPGIGAVAPSAQAMPIADPPSIQPLPSVDPASVAAPVAPAPSAAIPAQPTMPQGDNQQLAGPVDDTDTAFDQEWVGRAREVIQRTHSDPYLQSQELGKLKAQYIKLRYNKEIKVSD
jgi:hypothetical protein